MRKVHVPDARSQMQMPDEQAGAIPWHSSSRLQGSHAPVVGLQTVEPVLSPPGTWAVCAAAASAGPADLAKGVWSRAL